MTLHYTTENDISHIPLEQRVAVSNGLLARLLAYHGNNPPDESSRAAVGRIRQNFADQKRAKADRRSEKAAAVLTAALNESVSDSPVYKNKAMTILATEVAEKWGMTVQELRAKTRPQKWSQARQEFCYRASVECGYSTVMIGRFMGRDHSTAMYAISRHRERMLEVV